MYQTPLQKLFIKEKLNQSTVEADVLGYDSRHHLKLFKKKKKEKGQKRKRGNKKN